MPIFFPVLPLVAASILFLLPHPPAPERQPGQAEEERYAVVVHPSVRAADLSLIEVRRIFLGERQFWPGGGRVVLLVQTPSNAAREVVLRHLYRMEESEFRRYWIARTFRHDVVSGPKIVSSSALARRLTAQIPGAVSVIPFREVDESVKVLRIDGLHPTDAGYPLVRESAGMAS